MNRSGHMLRRPNKIRIRLLSHDKVELLGASLDCQKQHICPAVSHIIYGVEKLLCVLHSSAIGVGDDVVFLQPSRLPGSPCDTEVGGDYQPVNVSFYRDKINCGAASLLLSPSRRALVAAGLPSKARTKTKDINPLNLFPGYARHFLVEGGLCQPLSVIQQQC